MMDSPMLVKILVEKGEIRFRCGDCNAKIEDMRVVCPQCGIELTGFLVGSETKAGLQKFSAVSDVSRVFLSQHGPIHTPVDLQWILGVRC